MKAQQTDALQCLLRGCDTHGAAYDVILVRVPADVSHTRLVTRQSGHNLARQNIINYEKGEKRAVKGRSV